MSQPRSSGAPTILHARACSRPVARATCRCGGSVPSVLQIFADQSVHDSVRPLAVPPVRLSLRSLADPACALCVAVRTLVEAVDLHLQAVEAELEHEMPLEETCSLVGEMTAA